MDKLKTVPLDSVKLSNKVNNEVFTKTVYDKLVAKVNNIDTSGFVLNTKFDTAKSNSEEKISDANKKIPNISEPVKEADYDAKKRKILSINDLATNVALTAVGKST